MESVRRDPEPGSPAAQTASLAAALRRVRIEAAQHSDVVAELRGAETARLEMLAEALSPVLAQVPEEVDLFDSGMTPGEHPRLFIDMLAFIEMGRDRRSYRFHQDTRHGRVLIAETEKLDTMVEQVTSYIARRLIERERALASDQTIEQAALALIARGPGAGRREAPPLPVARPGLLRRSLAMLLEVVGAVLLALLALGAIYALVTVAGPWWNSWPFG